jgi:hypothetical protein
MLSSMPQMPTMFRATIRCKPHARFGNCSLGEFFGCKGLLRCAVLAITRACSTALAGLFLIHLACFRTRVRDSVFPMHTLITRVGVIMLLLGLAVFPLQATAQTAPPGLLRTWNGGSSLVKLTIAQAGSGYTIHAWGKCSPTPCDWGTVPLGLYAPSVNIPVASVGMATFTTSFAIKTVIVRPVGSTLRVETLTNFTDHSTRSCYDLMEILH